LARIKYEFTELADMVDCMEPRNLNTTQLKAMTEYNTS
jgi:hypothetical protein